MKWKGAFLLALCGAAWLAVAQQVPNEAPSWAPKWKTSYTPPHKPITRLKDVLARHKGEANWREIIVDDELLHAEYVHMAPGAKVTPRFHPDTRIWWIVVDGRIRFDIEGQDPFVATKSSMVQVPMQTIYSMEAVDDKPALRLEVSIARAKTLYPGEAPPPSGAALPSAMASLPGFEWVKVKLNRRPAAYDRGNTPHINLLEMTKEGARPKPRFVHDDRAVANIIYGYEKDLPPLNVKDRGHYHPESSEFWLIMAGQVRYPIENVGTIIADEGDVVYVPPMTFHAPRFHGQGPSCRLAMNGYPNIAHLRSADPH